MEFAVPVFILIVLIAIVVIGLVVAALRQSRKAETLKEPTGSALRYRVPEGQDAAAVIAVLQTHGYEAATDPDSTHEAIVVIQCPNGAADDRDEVRGVLAQEAKLNMEGDRDPALTPVHFLDE
jgi:FtsZ-interacting cell division protein ZipA